MIDNLQLLYGITSVFFAIIAITTIIGSIIYTTKKRGIAGFLMIIGSVVNLFVIIAHPILSALANTAELEQDPFLLINYSITVANCIFSIIFVIGFLLAIIKLKKDS